MSLWTRLANVLRPNRLSREIDEELASHIAEGVDQGRDPVEARRSLGSALRHREESRDIRLLPRLDSLRADAVFGWRQLWKNKVTSAAAILSLALAIGASTAAFRLIDALLLRPLPIAAPERLYVVAFEGIGADGRTNIFDSSSYPMFVQMRAAVKEQAESIAVSYIDRIDLTFGSDQDMEKAHRQYVSGRMFSTFGLQPALGRLMTENDDLKPGAHPVAVLSSDYWTRRFGGDPRIIGRTLRVGDDLFEIIGVTEERFTGTETGTMTDLFLPMMMKNPRILGSGENFWLRTLVQLKPGVAAQPVQERLRATFQSIQAERGKNFSGMPRSVLDEFLKEKLVFEQAGAGRSNLQRDYRRSLLALGILVALVLLIACANVANLMTVRAASRAREMALRVSIGAGRGRLIQLVLTESAWLALLATALGAAFAWWSAPVIVGMINPRDDPARLALPADWRVLAFAMTLAIAVTFLFGLAPALRASAVKPASALRGGENPHLRFRLLHALIALQVAFCFVVHFVAGLFVTSFDRLSIQPTGFSAARILNLETVAHGPQPTVFWEQVAEHLRSVPGVETAALTIWPMMTGETRISSISIDGAAAVDYADLLSISPGWFDTMKIPILDGRDFRETDTVPGTTIVNQAFAKQYFNGENPTGKSFETVDLKGGRVRFQIAGEVRDARSRDNLRLPIRPTAYLPFNALTATARGTFVVRTSTANPLALASILRQEVPRARPEFRVTNIRTQIEIDQARTVRERLLAMLALFFAVVALLLAAIGLYGVLDYSVLQRRREIGIRIALGAEAPDIARRVTLEVFSMVLLGAAAGLTLGMASVKYIETLFYGVKPTDLSMLAVPWLTILAAALLASVPPVIHAMRIDPVTMLRSD